MAAEGEQEVVLSVTDVSCIPEVSEFCVRIARLVEQPGELI